MASAEYRHRTVSMLEKHGGSILLVVSMEEYEQLSAQPGYADKGETETKRTSRGGE